ncbi:hypothetical protein [Microbaculum marinum]|uniref:Tetratricopeptide repeat protein n=1 Tax=Microbaculum marinum TaxID=1764581 RepID=A0AAW9RX53_9HYPH
MSLSRASDLRASLGLGPERRRHRHRRGTSDNDGGSKWQIRPLILPTLLIITLAWTARQVIATTMSASLTRSAPDRALEWNPRNAEAMVRLAETRSPAAGADDAHLDGVESLARRALRETPLQAAALRQLALVAQARSENGRGVELMDIVGERTLRDALAHATLFDASMADGNLDAAIFHMDVLLRANPELWDEVKPALFYLASQPSARDPIVALLGENPPWRSSFLQEFARGSPDPGAAWAILHGLAQGPRPPSTDEIRLYFDRLVNAGQYEQAYFDWLRLIPPDRRRPLDYLYNGDFEFQFDGSPFDWTVMPIRGTETSVVAVQDDGKGQALRIEYAGTRVPYEHVRKVLMLPPGRYRLSGRVRAQDLRNERGLSWQISCAGGDRADLLETERISGTRPWSGFQDTFEVPKTGCPVQRLRLDIAARIAPEREISGTVWYDAMRISRAGPTSTATQPAG